MRGLAQLARVEADNPKTQKKPWGPRQGLFFIGLVFATVAFGYCATLFFFGPKLDLEKIHAEVLKLPPVQTWIWWQYLSTWTPGTRTYDRGLTDFYILQAQQRMLVAIVVGICGLLVAASGLLIRPARRR
jgi:uncharacterized metal-binding protein